MSSEHVLVCDERETAELIAQMAGGLQDLREGGGPMHLVGVRARGVPLAQRLAEEMAVRGERVGPVGALDITLHRDDLSQSRRFPVLRGTEVPFPVDGADVVLVDDVLFTGRTIRAAIDAICALGRPARIRLAVLVDRGWRELPIQPDVVGLRLETGRADRVQVRLRPIDATEEIVRTPAASPASPA